MKKSLVMALLIALALLGVSCTPKGASAASDSGSASTNNSDSKSARGKEAPASDHDFKYQLTKDGTGIEITGYTGNHVNLVIPKTIEGYPVKVVGGISNGSYAGPDPLKTYRRYDNSNIQTVVIPEGVEIVRGFYLMPSLRKVVLPDTVSVIGNGQAFDGCSGLTEINIPAGIKEIYGDAFRGCENLYDLHIPDSITSIEFTGTFKSSSHYHFLGCQKLPIATRQRLKDLGYKGSF